MNKTNPIIKADFPDPCVIRVEDTYYMLSTTMHFRPGAVILRSYDLQNWEIAGHVLTIWIMRRRKECWVKGLHTEKVCGAVACDIIRADFTHVFRLWKMTGHIFLAQSRWKDLGKSIH